MALACSMVLVSALSVTAVHAQSDPPSEPLFDELVAVFQTEALSFGLVVQTVGEFVFDRPEEGPGSSGENGFSIATARLSLSGRLDGGLSYFVQSDFTADPVLLDARLSYALSPTLAVDAGLFKAPFSAELLIAAPSIDFVNRSSVVSELAPARQVGVALRGSVATGGVGWSVGAFNGNGRSLSGNDGGLMWVGRVTAGTSSDEKHLDVGVNAAYSDDEGGGPDDFTGERLLLGADARFEAGRWMASAEVIAADLRPETGPDREPFGFQATVGHMLSPDRHQLLARFDAFDPDGEADRDQVILGWNFWPTSAFEVQVNYLIPTHGGSDVGDHGVLVNFQIAY